MLEVNCTNLNYSFCHIAQPLKQKTPRPSKIKGFEVLNKTFVLVVMISQNSVFCFIKIHQSAQMNFLRMFSTGG